MAAGVFVSPPLLAATFTVNSTSDAVDANPGDGVCRISATGTTCTLRAAVMEANAWPGPDTIILSATTYTLSISGAGEDAARTGDLDITGAGGDLTIEGPAGAASTTRITAGGSFSGSIDRVFHFLGKNNITLKNLTVERGLAQGSNRNGSGIYNAAAWVTLKDCQITQSTTDWSSTVNSGGKGGGIYNALGAKMTIDNCVISGNAATTVSNASEPDFNGGGAIFNGGEMTILGSVIESNTTTRFGGGVLNNGTLTITGSILRNNKGPVGSSSSFSGGDVGAGGALANLGGRVMLRDSWVNANQAMMGGGIHSSQEGSPTMPVVNIVSSAITGNSADQWGGGIDNWGTMRVSYSAITGNGVNSSGSNFGFGGVIPGDGGGIANQGMGDLLVEHSTVSGNIAGRAGGGIFNGSKASFVHATLSNNRAGSDTFNSVSYRLGSEVFINGASTASNKGVIFKHTIIAGTQTPAGNCLAAVVDSEGFNNPGILRLDPFTATSQGYNIDSGNTCALSGATDHTNISPQLAALSDFGQGATLPGVAKVPQWIHTPNAVSPAINAIPNASCPKPGIDQRLYIRPEIAGGNCDIGAVENSAVKASLADLGLALSSFSSTVTGATTRAVVGAPIRYDITLKNNGPNEAKGPITVTQSFDGDVVFDSSFSQDSNVTCGQSSTTTITCSKVNGLAKDETVEIALNVKPVIGDKRTLNATVSVSAADASVIDHVVDNDSVSLSRSLSSGDPVVNADAGNVNSGGAGAFGPGSLAALLVFGLWRGSRRRFRE